MNSNRPAANFETFKECLEYHLGPVLVNKHYDKISLWYSQGSSVEGAVFRIRELEKDPEDWGTIPKKYLNPDDEYQLLRDTVIDECINAIEYSWTIRDPVMILRNLKEKK